jgi:hypothetical protein
MENSTVAVMSPGGIEAVLALYGFSCPNAITELCIRELFLFVTTKRMVECTQGVRYKSERGCELTYDHGIFMADTDDDGEHSQ